MVSTVSLITILMTSTSHVKKETNHEHGSHRPVGCCFPRPLPFHVFSFPLGLFEEPREGLVQGQPEVDCWPVVLMQLQ